MNNDRLKFRVFYSGDYSITPYCTIDMNGKVWLDASIMRGDGLGDPDTDIIDITNKCTVEMSTGLKDKNGNLIYEGDIVIGRKEIVVCELKEYKDVVEYKDGAYFPFNWTGVYNPEKFEIIGNIHKQKVGE